MLKVGLIVALLCEVAVKSPAHHYHLANMHMCNVVISAKCSKHNGSLRHSWHNCRRKYMGSGISRI